MSAANTEKYILLCKTYKDSEDADGRGKSIRVNVFRFDPASDPEPVFHEFKVPWEHGMSAMDALDYIYHQLDGTLAYYGHAGCELGICGRCTGRINGQPGLLCQTPVDGDIRLEPLSRNRVIRDLVMERSENEGA
jgi:succinate dehydrogenase/fumarate reductase-like Fe-S protein